MDKESPAVKKLKEFIDEIHAMPIEDLKKLFEASKSSPKHPLVTKFLEQSLLAREVIK